SRRPPPRRRAAARARRGMDAGAAAAARRRRAWIGWKRRADGAGTRDADVDRRTHYLHDALRIRIDARHGAAVRTAPLAAGAHRDESDDHARTLRRRRMCVDRTWTLLGLSAVRAVAVTLRPSRLAVTSRREADDNQSGQCTYDDRGDCRYPE